jgi:hypothetical protein
MARRGLWVIGGVAVGVGALALAPETRTWLRRRLGMEPEDRQWFEEEGVELPEHEGDEPLDTRESRFSLRARLAEEGHGEPAATAPPEPETPPAPTAFPTAAPPAPPPAAPPAPAFEPAATAPEPETPPAPTAFPTAAPPPAAPAFEPPVPAPESEYVSYESVPAVTPEVDAPKTPGEDTNEIEPLPPDTNEIESLPAEGASESPDPEPPLPPPTPLRPPAPPPPSRPFTGEGASFRSAIDAARERVHGAAREATPDEGEGTEPIDERP